MSKACARELRMYRHAAVMCCTQQMKLAVFMKAKDNKNTVSLLKMWTAIRFGLWELSAHTCMTI